MAALLAQRQAISNWDAFAAANNIAGWDAATPVCNWTGIVCKPGSTTANKFDMCAQRPSEGVAGCGRGGEGEAGAACSRWPGLCMTLSCMSRLHLHLSLMPVQKSELRAGRQPALCHPGTGQVGA